MNYAPSEGLDGVRIATGALAMVGLPACVVDSGGRALAVNGLFEQLAPHVVIGSHYQVCIANKAANELLRQSVERLSSRPEKAVGPVPVPATETSRALILHLVSSRRSVLNMLATASALMVATPLLKASAPSPALVAALFNLTRSEARVAKGILEGKPVNRLAIELGLSVATVRSYLKSVFEKTNVHRQAELVLLLAGAQPLIR
jgi:DNA-binding CsgD family transcriptional regulator